MSRNVPGAPAPAQQPARAGAVQVAGVVTFPLLGAVLTVAGMPVDDVLLLLAGSGTIGAMTFTAADGGRRLLTALAAALGAAAGPGKR